MAEYTLHCMAESGHSYKVALMLQLCGADWSPRWVDFFNGETRTDAFRETYNELGEVPVLETDGQMLTQSGVILDWLVERFDQYGWNTEAERREVLRWTLFDNHKISSQLGVLRFLRTIAKTGETETTKWLDGRCRSALSILDKHLASNAFAIGNKPTIADFSLCGYMFYEGETGIDLNDYMNVTSWLERIKALPGWDHPNNLMPSKAPTEAA